MKSRKSLAISSILSVLVTFAAAPALATTHLDLVRDLAYNIAPADNAWGSPCSIDWVNYTATTNGACLFTLAIREADPTITVAKVNSWWGSNNPGSAVFYDKIVAENHFEWITHIEDIFAGDLISAKWGTSNGHSMIVESDPVEVTAFAPLVDDTTQWLVSVIDSATSAHGKSDSRYKAEANGLDDQGVGKGVMRLYSNDDGAITGYTWSDISGSTYYPQATRALVVGRFVRGDD